MRSPCNQVCRVDAGRCVGCGRTLAEIASWTRFTEAEREAVMARLASSKDLSPARD